ncbi:hypothetical protein CYMTET_48009 [Cymbomonas tetramitiformis]|uniref:Uncharacterized protein n=1 Tax=Cymbomonas tetramitiformis TaxID=36881 RepID=A0AAE0EW21_9CHLO|nr:hypothetical protein CYMTET_48009 [Cymbomonas tetramitiformis]
MHILGQDPPLNRPTRGAGHDGAPPLQGIQGKAFTAGKNAREEVDEEEGVGEQTIGGSDGDMGEGAAGGAEEGRAARRGGRVGGSAGWRGQVEDWGRGESGWRGEERREEEAEGAEGEGARRQQEEGGGEGASGCGEGSDAAGRGCEWGEGGAGRERVMSLPRVQLIHAASARQPLLVCAYARHMML